MVPINAPRRRDRRPLGLTARMVAASALAAVLGMLTFGLVLLAIRSMHDAARMSDRAVRANAAANELERLVIDLETGARGFLITGDEAFLEPYVRSRTAIPASVAALRAMLEDAAQRELLAEIAEDAAAFRREWVDPLVVLARRDRSAAAARVGSGEGKRRLDALRTSFAEFREREAVIQARRDERADAAERRAVVVALLGVWGSVAIVAVYALYLRRTVTEPVSALTGATARIAEGDFSVRVPERGAGEVGELAAAFNAMAETLERNRAELAHRTAELEAVLDSTLDGILLTDPDGSVVFANAAMDRTWRELGMPAKGTVWERIARLAIATSRPEYYAHLFAEKVQDPDFDLAEEFEVPAVGRSFVGYTRPVRRPDGTSIGRLFSLRETTAEREAARLKEELVATVSHELRTPLTSIVGFLDLVVRGSVGVLAPDQARYLEIARQNAERLSSLVEDLLFLAQVNAQAFPVERRPTDVAAVVKACVDAARAVAAEQEVELRLDAEPLLAHVDAARVGQLVDNLLSNALKFTPDGGSVAVTLRRDGDDAVVEVADSGVGIPREEQSRLFERFFRASTARATDTPGTGLGLAICRAIAEAHDGTIGFTSEEGVGTTFRVVLPLRTAAEIAPPVRP